VYVGRSLVSQNIQWQNDKKSYLNNKNEVYVDDYVNIT
jgi:hypothetical protein